MGGQQGNLDFLAAPLYCSCPDKMALQKVRPTALQRFFETSTYSMYVFTLEKPLRLGGRSFCLAILFGFASGS